jgi:hypothetical protein
LRSSILSSHRRILLSRLHRTPNIHSWLQQIPGGFINYLFHPPDPFSFSGFASLVQNTGFLLTAVYNQPDLLVTAVINQTKHSAFGYIARFAVP